MLLRRWLIPSLVVCAAGLVAQEALDRDAYAREHVKFLVAQLDQWSVEFPQQFYAALMKPPVDSTKVSEAAKAGPAEFGESIKRLAGLSSAKDLLSNAAFRKQLEKTLDAMKEVNQAMSIQRFPTVLQSDWDQIRSTLNNLARVYKVETLAVLEPPAAAGKGEERLPQRQRLAGLRRAAGYRVISWINRARNGEKGCGSTPNALHDVFGTGTRLSW